MKEQIEQYVKQVKERHEDCRNSEAATKQSLIGPLFAILGYDMADPRECKPEYRTDFGKGERAATPVDWAFAINGVFAFFVEAKEAGARITRYAEQLGMYFAKEPAVKLGILTNGVHWRFFTDLINEHVMDKEAFLEWNVLQDEIAPLDFLTILQKSQFKQQLVRTFAERKRHQSLLVAELARLLAPSPEFIRLAIQNIETRSNTAKILEEWNPILKNAIKEWAKQFSLAMALQRPVPTDPETGSAQDDSERTHREDWESKASSEALVTTAELLKLVKTIEPKASLKYNKYYIGLEIDGSPRNFVTFRPQKKSRVLTSIKLPQENGIDEQLTEAGIKFLEYDARWNCYRVRVDSTLNAKQRDLLRRLIQQAWEAIGKD